MLRLPLIGLLVISSAYAVSAKEWRGLIPLRSTCADVERLLGPPPPGKDESRTLNKGRSLYFLKEGEVYFVFAEEGFGGHCLMTVPPGTVLSIRVTPKANLLVADLKIDEKKFRKFDPSDPPGLGYEAYLNEEDGFIVKAFKGAVEEMIYVASALDRPKCPNYYENLEEIVRVFVCSLSLTLKFDEYGDISFADEKARLDNFAIQLNNQVDDRGYIIVYAGRKAVVAEALSRANRAKQYLTNIRGIHGERIITLDGGYRESLSVELFVGAQNAEAPTPTPTIKANDVEVIDQKTGGSRRPQ